MAENGLKDETTPIPDVLGARGPADDGPTQSTTAGASGLTFDEALALHKDLETFFTTAKKTFDEMATLNDELASAAEKQILVPNGPENLACVQLKFARHLDEILSKLDTEKDQLRVEVLREMYSNLVPYWHSLFIQTHMARASQKSPGHIHETLIGEATALLDRVRPRV